MPFLLVVFIVLRLAQQSLETFLSVLNRGFALEPGRLAEAGRALGIGDDDLARTVAYSGDRFRFGRV